MSSTTKSPSKDVHREREVSVQYCTVEYVPHAPQVVLSDTSTVYCTVELKSTKRTKLSSHVSPFTRKKEERQLWRTWSLQNLI